MPRIRRCARPTRPRSPRRAEGGFGGHLLCFASSCLSLPIPRPLQEEQPAVNATAAGTNGTDSQGEIPVNGTTIPEGAAPETEEDVGKKDEL